MTLNRELCNIAQKWADYLAAEKHMKHSSHEGRRCSKGHTGENLHWRGSTGDVDMNGAIAVDNWYSEIKDYDYDNHGFAKGTGTLYIFFFFYCMFKCQFQLVTYLFDIYASLTSNYRLDILNFNFILDLILFLGHFTQVVWEKSTELGVAFTTFKHGKWNKVMVVANYYPAGNVKGAFEENVKPPM